MDSNDMMAGLTAIQLLIFAGPAIVVAAIVAMKLYQAKHPRDGRPYRDSIENDHVGEPFTSEPLTR